MLRKNIFVLFICAVIGLLVAMTVVSKQMKNTQLLVFTKTNGWRHSSIPDGVKAIWTIGQKNNWTITFSEDSTQFNSESLNQYQAIVFLNTTGNILGKKEEIAFEEYMRNGGNFVGIHSASDTEQDWTFYEKMLGAQFENHPTVQEVELNVHKDCKHTSIAHLGEKWNVTDEWYNFSEPVADYVNVLLDIDESTIDGVKMNAYHPIAWYHHFEGGRCFYTGLGHTSEIYQDKDYLKHLEGGINWAIGQ